MTIIAGFSVEKHPVLVGDLLLTDERTEELPISIPAASEINSKMPAASRRIVGLRQKLNILDDRLAVCWAGSSIQARSMLRYFKEIRLNGNTSIEAIEQVIREVPPTEKNDLSLIGLILDEKGSKVFTYEVHGYDCGTLGKVRIQGSGTQSFVEILKQLAATIEIGPKINAPTTASGVCLAALCQAKGLELFTGTSLLEAWGGGFELATIAGNKIRKFGNYLNIHFQVEVANDTSVNLDFIPRVEKVDYWRDTNIIHVAEFQCSDNSSDGQVSAERKHIILPLLASKYDYDWNELPDTNWDFDALCIYVHVKPTSGTNYTLSVVYSKSLASELFELKHSNEKFETSFSQKLLNHLASEAKEHIKTAANS